MPKTDDNKKTWEDSDVPALCENCLGPNPYVRMTREKYGEECKLCTRPFTIFRWSPEKGSKPRRTVICQTCARQKNACQSCMLDLTYGLPLSIRDAALNMSNNGSISSDVATNVIMKQYVAQKFESSQKSFEEEDKEKEAENEGGQLVISDEAKNLLRNLAKAMPYYKGPVGVDSNNSNNPTSKTSSLSSNLPPLSPAMKTEVNKIISKLPLNGSILNPPKDETITSLFITGIEDDLPDYKIREHFQSFGAIKNLVLVHRAKCGFVTYEKRSHAESAANSLKSTSGKVVINGCKLKAVWGKPRSLGSTYQQNYLVGLAVKKSLRSGPSNKSSSSNTPSSSKNSSLSPIAPPSESTKSSINYESQKAGYER